MAETVNGIRVRIQIDYDVSGPTDGVRLTGSMVYDETVTDGTGSNQLGQLFVDKARALNATNEDLDMYGSANKDSFLQNLAMTQLGLVYVHNLDTTTGHTITVTRPASNGIPGPFVAAGDGVTLGANGVCLIFNPVDKTTVTESTGDLLNVAASASSTYNVLLGGDNA